MANTQKIKNRQKLEVIQHLGEAVGHSVIVEEAEMRGSQFMRIICFNGIPACCLSAKGCGPTVKIAKENAANVMFEFFRSAVPNETIECLLSCRDGSTNQSELKPLLDMFQLFENFIAAKFRSRGQVSQYDLTYWAVHRGKKVKKQVVRTLWELGYSNRRQPTAYNSYEENRIEGEKRVNTYKKFEESDEEDDVGISNQVVPISEEILKENNGNEGNKRVNRYKKFEDSDSEDKVGILDNNQNPTHESFSKSTSSTAGHREAHVIQKQNAQESESRLTKRIKRECSTNSSDSDKGPPVVICSIPKDCSTTSFAPNLASVSQPAASRYGSYENGIGGQKRMNTYKKFEDSDDENKVPISNQVVARSEEILKENNGNEGNKRVNRYRKFEDSDSEEKVGILDNNQNSSESTSSTAGHREAHVVQKQNAQESEFGQTKRIKREFPTESSDSNNGPPLVLYSIPRNYSTASFPPKRSSVRQPAARRHKTLWELGYISRSQQARYDIYEEDRIEVKKRVNTYKKFESSDEEDGFGVSNQVEKGPSSADYWRRTNPEIKRQSRTIGVSPNWALVESTEKHVSSVATNSGESISELSLFGNEYYANRYQPKNVYDRTTRAKNLLSGAIKQIFPGKMFSLRVTGSSINGCGSMDCDMDMCLCYPIVDNKYSYSDEFYSEHSFSSRILRTIEETFKHRFGQLVNSFQFIPSKVPVLNLHLNGEFRGLNTFISVNNTEAIHNSYLVHHYSLSDARFPLLTLMVKRWATSVGVNDSHHGLMDNYTLTLLVIHFLQCGVHPAVLPNLQFLFPDKFNLRVPFIEMLWFVDFSTQLPVRPQNDSSLGELLAGFFHYYSYFDFERHAISVRTGRLIPRTDLPARTHLHPMFVEEPFELVNTARFVWHMDLIRASFLSASGVFSREKFNAQSLGIEFAPKDQPQ